jgi:hypothetical protein
MNGGRRRTKNVDRRSRIARIKGRSDRADSSILSILFILPSPLLFATVEGVQSEESRYDEHN